MSHHATSRFWRLLAALPDNIQQLAHENYDLLRLDPRHPSLHFKRVGRFFSVRVGTAHRALGVEHSEGILWFWIGEHDEYDRIIRGN